MNRTIKRYYETLVYNSICGTRGWSAVYSEGDMLVTMSDNDLTQPRLSVKVQPIV